MNSHWKNALQVLIEHSEQGYALFDATDTLQYGNPAFRKFLHLAPHEYPTWADLMRRCHLSKKGTHIDTENVEMWLASTQSRRGKLPFRTNESDLYDGTWLNVTETTLENGWMLCVFTDVTNLSVNNHDLRHQRDQAWRASMTDELTGISNRRYLMENLQRAFENSHSKPFAIALLDLDFFKRINDSHGHAAGDAVLRDFSRKMLEIARREDIASRMGGEEFLLLLRRTDAQAASGIVERLYTLVRTDTPLARFPEIQYTFSAGIAQVQEGDTTDSLLQRADTALYRAKSEGRDCYRIG